MITCAAKITGKRTSTFIKSLNDVGIVLERMRGGAKMWWLCVHFEVNLDTLGIHRKKANETRIKNGKRELWLAVTVPKKVLRGRALSMGFILDCFDDVVDLAEGRVAGGEMRGYSAAADRRRVDRMRKRFGCVRRAGK